MACAQRLRIAQVAGGELDVDAVEMGARAGGAHQCADGIARSRASILRHRRADEAAGSGHQYLSELLMLLELLDFLMPSRHSADSYGGLENQPGLAIHDAVRPVIHAVKRRAADPVTAAKTIVVDLVAFAALGDLDVPDRSARRFLARRASVAVRAGAVRCGRR